ncbi:MAG: hypothetical protein RL302_1850, partial [Pseudomonadota bacterium]
MTEVRAPLQAQIVQWLVQPGDTVQPGDVLVILEAMKMEHELRATHAARVTELFFSAGETVADGELLLNQELLAHIPRGLETNFAQNLSVEQQPAPDTHAVRADLLALQQRQARTLDAARPEAVAKRHAQGLRTARENIADLCDADSFIEYGALAVAAQRSRRTEEDLIANTPADGMVTGMGAVNGQRAVVMAYDATVLAGTQGMRNHQKTDRMLGLALHNKLPVVLFAEGGGGRPGDVDMPIVAGLHVATFASFARL